MVYVPSLGEVYAFGYGGEGQLGEGRTSNQLVPLPLDLAVRNKHMKYSKSLRFSSWMLYASYKLNPKIENYFQVTIKKTDVYREMWLVGKNVTKTQIKAVSENKIGMGYWLVITIMLS